MNEPNSIKQPEDAARSSVQRMVMPPMLERWEAIRIGHLNELAADGDARQAAEWRERSASRGIRWQRQVAIAIAHERSARQRYDRARAWRAYGKTLAA